MRICDLKDEEIKIGMRVKSLAKPRCGTIVSIDPDDDYNSWIKWDGDKRPMSGFYGNECTCELICDELGNPVIVEVK